MTTRIQTEGTKEKGKTNRKVLFEEKLKKRKEEEEGGRDEE